MEKLLEALWRIADYPSGGLVEQGKCSGDRSDMIHTARIALIKHYGVGSFASALKYKPQQKETSE
jgi:hypothetical protein